MQKHTVKNINISKIVNKSQFIVINFTEKEIPNIPATQLTRKLFQHSVSYFTRAIKRATNVKTQIMTFTANIIKFLLNFFY